MALLIAIPIMLLVRAIYPMSDLVWFVILGALTALTATTVQIRVTQNWLSKGAIAVREPLVRYATPAPKLGDELPND